jgi:4-amino-4-deoxychorismate lyase
MKPSILTKEQILNQLKSARQQSQQPFLAMYSSWLGGIVTDPEYMILPIDDHLVHRGDGVFEAMKFYERRLYLADEHLDRLYSSAEKISLPVPYKKQQLLDLIIATLKAAKTETCTIRMFLSRGPGGFTPNPYDSCGSQLYIVVTTPKPFDPKKYENGVSVGISKIPMKEPFFATIKTCNYLPNVLMKKESVDNKWDFSVNISADGFVGESATENIALISKADEFLIPSFKYTLRGTTLLRMMKLAQPHVKAVREGDLTLKDFQSAQEILMCGTTMGVAAVTEFAGQKVGTGKPGSFVEKFQKLFKDDLLSYPQV